MSSMLIRATDTNYEGFDYVVVQEYRLLLALWFALESASPNRITNLALGSRYRSGYDPIQAYTTDLNPIELAHSTKLKHQYNFSSHATIILPVIIAKNVLEFCINYMYMYKREDLQCSQNVACLSYANFLQVTNFGLSHQHLRKPQC